MQEFIQSAVSQLGITEDQAKSATGGLLNFVKEQADGNAAQELIAKLPGAEGLMATSSSSGESGGGMLGGLAAGLGSKLGGVGGAMAALKASGLDAGKISPFVTMLVNYAKQKAGPELVEKVLSQLPALKSLA